MKRLVIGGAIAALVAGGTGLSFAGAPGPNGHNDYGLCKAFFSGSEKGQNQKAANGVAFIALQAAAGDQDGDGDSDRDDVAQFCSGKTPGGK